MAPMGATPFVAWPELSLMPRLPGNIERNASGHARPPMKDNKSGQSSQDSRTVCLCRDHKPHHHASYVRIGMVSVCPAVNPAPTIRKSKQSGSSSIAKELVIHGSV